MWRTESLCNTGRGCLRYGRRKKQVLGFGVLGFRVWGFEFLVLGLMVLGSEVRA
jgi:hypothetical protein